VWLIELLTKWWEINARKEEERLRAFLREHPDARGLIAAFSIGLDKYGEPTAANREVVDMACWLYDQWHTFLPARSPSPRRELMFCTGQNQPVPISSARAMLEYAQKVIPRQLAGAAALNRQLITLDEKSMDTPGNAGAVAQHILTSVPMGGCVVVALVCHPLHLRRSLLCLRQIIRMRAWLFRIHKISVEVIAWPAIYAPEYSTLEYPAGRRIYEHTPGQPWLNSHASFLFYEMLAYVFCLLLPGVSKKVKKAKKSKKPASNPSP